MKNKIQIAAFLLALFLVGCGEDSPAPGCAEGFGMGGCFGKTIITNIQVEPGMDCLSISANNCNGGVLEIRNGCQGALTLEGIKIAPSDSVTLDLQLTQDGSYTPVEIYSNFSELELSEDLPVSISGMVGGEPVEIRYTRTAPLCE